MSPKQKKQPPTQELPRIVCYADHCAGAWDDDRSDFGPIRVPQAGPIIAVIPVNYKRPPIMPGYLKSAFTQLASSEPRPQVNLVICEAAHARKRKTHFYLVPAREKLPIVKII